MTQTNETSPPEPLLVLREKWLKYLQGGSRTGHWNPIELHFIGGVQMLVSPDKTPSGRPFFMLGVGVDQDSLLDPTRAGTVDEIFKDIANLLGLPIRLLGTSKKNPGVMLALGMLIQDPQEMEGIIDEVKNQPGNQSTIDYL